MTLFGSPGFGEALDCFCCFPVLGGIGAILYTAIVGAMLRSVWDVVLSFGLAMFVGLLIVPPAITHELRDTSDSHGVHAMLWQLVWLWAASLCAPLAAVVSLFRGRRSGSKPSDDMPG
jgi:hypothetical protein